MKITPQETTTQPISDDQDLAKALAGVLPDEPEVTSPAGLDALQFEETPGLPVIQLPTQQPVEVDTPAVAEEAIEIVETTAPPEPQAAARTEAPVGSTAPSDSLDAIKNKALEELRPLLDQADIPAEEKFDTFLMLIRSTDDPSLIAPAHDAAQSISDETRKAEALIDIIKEINYLTNKTAKK